MGPTEHRRCIRSKHLQSEMPSGQASLTPPWPEVRRSRAPSNDGISAILGPMEHDVLGKQRWVHLRLPHHRQAPAAPAAEIFHEAHVRLLSTGIGRAPAFPGVPPIENRAGHLPPTRRRMKTENLSGASSDLLKRKIKLEVDTSLYDLEMRGGLTTS